MIFYCCIERVQLGYIGKNINLGFFVGVAQMAASIKLFLMRDSFGEERTLKHCYRLFSEITMEIYSSFISEPQSAVIVMVV